MKLWKPLIALFAFSLLFLLNTPWSSSQGDDASTDAGRLRYRAEPLDLGLGGERVGELIPDVAVVDLAGTSARLSDHLGENGLVLAVRDVECPLSRKYGPRLARMEKAYRERGFGFLYFNPNSHDSTEDMAKDVERHGFSSPYVDDMDAVLGKALDAAISTEVFVLDAARTLVYRGAIDDQYGLGYAKPEPAKHYLADSIDAVAEGRTPDVRATTASGCAMNLGEAEPAKGELTYHNRISRIVQNKCESCHRAGGAGPFELTSYDELKGRSFMVEWVLEDRIMPPFYVDEGYGPWANDFSLTEKERADFLAWIEADAPEGDPKDAPRPRRWTTGWTIGEPDYVVQMPEPYTVPAEGVVRYQYFYAKTDQPVDRWIRKMEIRSTAPQVVHHVLVFLESPELVQRLRERRKQVEDPWQDEEYRRTFAQLQGGRHGFFASTVPGQSGIVFPEGMGKKLPAGSWLKFQMHYTPNGTEAVDRSEIGFVFADEGVHTEVRTTSAINEDFVIPAGHPNYEVTAEYVFPEDASVLSLFPHTHLRGTKFLYEAIYPDGRTETWLPLSRYDFNWQLNYLFQKPLDVPAGTVVRAKAWYDNSAKNPANPDPSADVEFGEQTWDEMMIGYVNWVPRSGG